jgi:hypothetical protein
MPKSQYGFKWTEFEPGKPETWLPTYGKWCGPGWSAGKRVAKLMSNDRLVSPAANGCNGQFVTKFTIGDGVVIGGF